MGMLLTDAQRKWVDILKESAKKKPLDLSIRPKVCVSINCLLWFSPLSQATEKYKANDTRLNIC